MRIGINLLYLLPGVVGGTQTYATSLINSLVDQYPDDEFVVYLNKIAYRQLATLDLPDTPRLLAVETEVSGERRELRYAYEQFRLPQLAASHRLEVLHSMGYVGPLRTQMPHVVTVHDLIYVGFRDHMPWLRRAALQLFVRGTVRSAARTITVSQASRSQIEADIPAAKNKITVVHEAGREVPPGWQPDASVPGHYGINAPYLMAFGSPSASKNIPRLVNAFGQIAAQVPHSLVLVGHLAESSAITNQIRSLGLQDRIITTGYIPDEHVMSLLGCSDAFCFPSLYEGFGLPILDAQSVGVPVASSNAASLPEIAGDGAMFFNPTSVNSMARALIDVLTNDTVRTTLVEKGVANSAGFSWNMAAQQTHRVYEEVAG